MLKLVGGIAGRPIRWSMAKRQRVVCSEASKLNPTRMKNLSWSGLRWVGKVTPTVINEAEPCGVPKANLKGSTLLFFKNFRKFLLEDAVAQNF